MIVGRLLLLVNILIVILLLLVELLPGARVDGTMPCFYIDEPHGFFYGDDVYVCVCVCFYSMSYFHVSTIVFYVGNVYVEHDGF